MIRVLGSVKVMTGEQTTEVAGKMARTLLSLLVINNGQTLTADQLIDAMWGERPPPTVQNSLANAASAVRKAVGAENLESVAGGYRLVVDPEQTDLGLFRSLIDQAAGLPPVQRIPLLTRALDLWNGTCFGGTNPCYDLESANRSLLEKRWFTELELLNCQLDSGQMVEPAEVQRLIDDRPSHQGAWATLGAAQASVGDRQGGLASVRLAIDSLRNAGLIPSDELKAAELRLLVYGSGQPEISLGTSTPVVARADELRRLLDRVLGAIDGSLTFSVVAGEAGIGKSSIVDALIKMANLRCFVVRCDQSQGLRTDLAASLGVDGDGLIRALRSLSVEGPVLLVVEDTHRDRGSTAVLGDLAAALDKCAVAIVATTRPGRTVDALRRLALDHRGTVLNVEGLDAAAFASLVPGRTIAELAPIVEELNGNPLLVLARLSAPKTTLDFNDYVRAEIAELNPIQRLVTDTLAVQLDGATIDQLAATCGLASEKLWEALEPLLDSGLVAERSTADGRVTVTIRHQLITDAILSAMSKRGIARLHGRIRDTLLGSEEDRGQTKRLMLAAHHAHLAAETGNPDDRILASRLCHRAGLIATGNSDWTQAAFFQEKALESAELVGDEHVGYCHLELGRAWFQLGAVEAADEFMKAALIASRLNNGYLMAQTAFAWSRGFFSQMAGVNEDLIRVTQRALTFEQPPEIRARLLAVEASELTFSPRSSDRFALAEEALAIANECDEQTRAFVLSHRQLTLAAAGTGKDRAETAEALLSLARDLGDPQIRFQGVFQRVGSALLDGDVELIERMLNEADSLAQDLGIRAHRWLTGQSLAALAYLRGDIARADALSSAAFEYAQGSHRSAEAWMMHKGQAMEFHRVTVGLDDVVPLLLDARDGRTQAFMVSGMLAWAGEAEAAAQALEADGLRNLDELPANFLERPTWQSLTLIADATNNTSLAGQLLPRFLRHPTDLGISMVSHPCGYYYAALCCRTLGRWDEAIAHHWAAIELHHTKGHPLMELESRRELVITLRRAGLDGYRGEWVVENLIEEVNRAANLAKAQGLRL